MFTRRDFLAATGAIASGGAAGAAAKVTRWDVITIGNLSRNHYWGESDEKPLRDAICTCTLISGDGFRLLVDPSLKNAGDMARELDRRTGVKPGGITAVFVTHEHGDHYAGIEHFPNAPWFAAAPVAEILNARRGFSRRFEIAPALLPGGVQVIATPGHTKSHHSLRFDCAGSTLVVAGDAVATADYWRERRSYYNAIDAPLAAKKMDEIAAAADIVVPGHDNYFLVE